MPPTDPPVAARPVARPRRRRNQWPGAAKDGVKRREAPKPVQRPKERIKCQSSKREKQGLLWSAILWVNVSRIGGVLP